MRISDRQVLLLFQTLRDSLRIADGAGIFTYDHTVRGELYDQIVAQQDRTLVEYDSRLRPTAGPALDRREIGVQVPEPGPTQASEANGSQPAP